LYFGILKHTISGNPVMLTAAAFRINAHQWHPRQRRVVITKLKELPYTARGDKQFLVSVEQEMIDLPDAYVRLIERELSKRPTVYEELVRLLRRHRPAFLD
jgi:hypothetical protein